MNWEIFFVQNRNPFILQMCQAEKIIIFHKKRALHHQVVFFSDAFFFVLLLVTNPLPSRTVALSEKMSWKERAYFKKQYVNTCDHANVFLSCYKNGPLMREWWRERERGFRLGKIAVNCDGGRNERIQKHFLVLHLGACVYSQWCDWPSLPKSSTPSAA